jgi:hypothetical protein
MAERTTSMVNRGFVRERKTEKYRRKEWAGWAAAAEVSVEDAFCGRVKSDEEEEDDDDDDGEPLACFMACRLRCGGRLPIGWLDSAPGWRDALDAAVVDDALDARPLSRASRHADFSNARFDRKNADGASGATALDRGACRFAAAASHRREEAATWLRRPSVW